MKRVIISLFLLIAVCVAAGILTVSFFLLKSPATRGAVGAVLSGDYTPEKAFPNQDQVNILMLGRDLDRDRHGRIIQTRGRTDSIMLAHVDFRDNAVCVLSIPRDTLVRIPGYRGKRRISYANAFGGPELAQKTISDFLGLRPDYYLLVNFDVFERAIDAVGGLETTVDKDLDYDDNWGDLHIHLKAGKQVLDGKQAMGFVRYRQSNDGVGESDFVRIRRQQELLRAIRARLSCANVMFRMPALVGTISNDIQGDLSPAQMICLARFLNSLPGDCEIRMETLPATHKSGVFVQADLDATKQLVNQMFLEKQQ